MTLILALCENFRDDYNYMRHVLGQKMCGDSIDLSLDVHKSFEVDRMTAPICLKHQVVLRKVKTSPK